MKRKIICPLQKDVFKTCKDLPSFLHFYVILFFGLSNYTVVQVRVPAREKTLYRTVLVPVTGTGTGITSPTRTIMQMFRLKKKYYY